MTATQLDSLVTLLRSRAAPPDFDIAQARARFEKTAVFLGGAPDAKCEKVDAGGVPAEWVMAPGCDTGRAILYLHGGGYAIGSLNTHRRLAYDISAASAAMSLRIFNSLSRKMASNVSVDKPYLSFFSLLITTKFL